ncbi:MAG: FtsW/RodA/SpoVE family cell cycle protein [Planctomycetes bacterium]|nr:FtsW/RodA/SpoVE family cell cycle protein [Planctomycetota bacterium]
MHQSDPQARATTAGIILAAAALLTIGVVTVASASASLDASIWRAEFWKTTFGRQAILAVVALCVLLLVSTMGPQWLGWRPKRRLQPVLLLLGATVVCLVLVLVPGIGLERNGARRWLHLGGTVGFGFQPSEPAKVALVVFLAAYLSGRQRLLERFFKGVLPAALAVGVCVALIGPEDFGTAALLAAVGGLILLIGGVRFWHLLYLAIPALAAFAGLLMAKPYRLKRLTAFMDIWADPQGVGYHPVQSLITLASGGWFGRGLGGGVQKYGYLPESRTDFIFAVWCEETGLLGALVVLLLFGTLLILGLRAVWAARTTFERLLAAGVTLLVTLQALLNIAVVTVWAPTTGIALPLVSAGGSGLVCLGAAIGLLAGVALRGQYDTEPRVAGLSLGGAARVQARGS